MKKWNMCSLIDREDIRFILLIIVVPTIITLLSNHFWLIIFSINKLCYTASKVRNIPIISKLDV